jgi:hypothetical protein
LDCQPRREWSYHFPGEYLGDIYAQIAAGVDAPVTVTVTFKWGPMRWQQPIEVSPGLVSSGRGGTLIGTGKQTSTIESPNDPNPVLIVQTDQPVCVTFGTARTSPKPVPSIYMRATGWAQR